LFGTEPIGPRRLRSLIRGLPLDSAFAAERETHLAELRAEETKRIAVKEQAAKQETSMRRLFGDTGAIRYVAPKETDGR